MKINFKKYTYPAILTLFILIVAISAFYTIGFFENQINRAFSVDESKAISVSSVNFENIRHLSKKLGIELQGENAQ